MAHVGGTDYTRIDYILQVDEHAEWLVHSTAVGAAIFLSIIIVTYLLGDTQPLKTVSLNYFFTEMIFNELLR